MTIYSASEIPYSDLAKDVYSNQADKGQTFIPFLGFGERCS